MLIQASSSARLMVKVYRVPLLNSILVCANLIQIPTKLSSFSSSCAVRIGDSLDLLKDFDRDIITNEMSVRFGTVFD